MNQKNNNGNSLDDSSQLNKHGDYKLQISRVSKLTENCTREQRR